MASPHRSFDGVKADAIYDLIEGQKKHDLQVAVVKGGDMNRLSQKELHVIAIT